MVDGGWISVGRPYKIPSFPKNLTSLVECSALISNQKIKYGICVANAIGTSQYTFIRLLNTTHIKKGESQVQIIIITK